MSVWTACRQEVGGPSLQQLFLHLTEQEETPRINLLASWPLYSARLHLGGPGGIN